jgi:hypothetical protein
VPLTHSGASGGGAKVTVLVRGPASVRETVFVEDNGDGTFDVGLCCRVSGTYSLDVRCNGTSVSGSPFSVVADHVAFDQGLVRRTPINRSLHFPRPAISFHLTPDMPCPHRLRLTAVSAISRR